MMLIKRQIAPGMIQQIQMQCDQCRGQGKQIEHPCTTCGGQGCKSGPRHYEVYVKPGQVRGSNVVWQEKVTGVQELHQEIYS